jgi:hypothetical protein
VDWTLVAIGFAGIAGTLTAPLVAGRVQRSAAKEDRVYAESGSQCTKPPDSMRVFRALAPSLEHRVGGLFRRCAEVPEQVTSEILREPFHIHGTVTLQPHAGRVGLWARPV